MPKKKIALINPKNPLREGASLGSLSLATNAAFIPDNYDVVVVNQASGEKIPRDTKLAAITVNTVTARNAYNLSEELRRAGIPTVFGGVHPSVQTEEARKYASAVVVGEGETVWDQLLDDFETGKLEGKLYTPGSFDMAESRLPRRELMGQPFMNTLQTSRGCPLGCDFCSVTNLYGSKYKYKPLELVEEELAPFKGRRVFLVDDNFFGVGEASAQRAKNLMGLLKKANLKSWMGQTSINIANNPEILGLARESGAAGFYIGFESLSESFLDAMSKRINLRQARKTIAIGEYTEVEAAYAGAVRTIQDHGIGVFGSFIYGTDHDTNRSLDRLRWFTGKSGMDTAYVKPLTPLPGTNVYDDFVREGKLFDDTYWMQDNYPVFTFKPKNLSAKDLTRNAERFVGMYNLPNSLWGAAKTLARTKNPEAAFLSGISNWGNYASYTAFRRENSDAIRDTLGSH